MSESVECSELPSELLLQIGKGLDTRIEILRFRGVCKSWCSTISCSDFIPRFPLKFPNPFPPPRRRRRRRLSWLAVSHDEVDHLHQQTICLLHEAIFYRLTPSASSDKGWLIKVEDCKMHLLDPHRERYESDSPNILPNNFVLLDYGAVELTRAHTLQIQSLIPIGRVNKVVMFNDCHVFVVYGDGKLGHAKCGDESLTCLGEKDMEFDDVIVYEGQVYVVDRFGIVWWIKINDSTLDLVKFWNPYAGGMPPTHSLSWSEASGYDKESSLGTSGRGRELENLRKQVNDLEIELRGWHRRKERDESSHDPDYIPGASSRGEWLHTYVADWLDRALGLGTRVVEPPNRSSWFCEVRDTGLKDELSPSIHPSSSPIRHRPHRCHRSSRTIADPSDNPPHPFIHHSTVSIIPSQTLFPSFPFPFAETVRFEKVWVEEIVLVFPLFPPHSVLTPNCLRNYSNP
nr:f-box protein [Quercus suber]